MASRELRVYKPGANGSAVKFQKREDKKNYNDLMAFFEIANQTGKSEDGFASFDWYHKENNPNSKSITGKLSELDIAKMILVLKGEVASVDLFHDPNKSYDDNDGIKRSTIIKFSRGDKGFAMNVSKKAGDDLRKSNITMSWEEGVLLEAWCQCFLQQFYV